jgi:hypothetical protein
MRRILKAIFGPRPEVKIAPDKRLNLVLSAIPDSTVEEKGFPRPQWGVIQKWVKENIPGDDVSVAYYEVPLDWLRILRARLGGTYAVFQSPHFMLLTARGEDAARSILRTSEAAMRLIEHWLGSAAARQGQGKHVVLDCDTIENYYDYVSYFYEGDRGVRASGGIFLGRGYQHIALPPLKDMKDTLIHEFAHNRVAHLPLPPWLNEGIAVTLEREIGGRRHGRIDREQRRKHQAHWTPKNISTFWRGDSFHDDDGEVVGLSYSLADTLVDLLVQDFPNFKSFVAEANRSDSGEAAAKNCLGIGLDELAATFLGPGDWSPKPNSPSVPA